MKRLLVFCSNPTDGGTAEMFVQCCLALSKNSDFQVDVIPCVDKLNKVKVFDMLPNLIRLDVASEAQICGDYAGKTSIIQRLFSKIKRNIEYASVKHRNMQIMETYIRENKIDSVLIHNGGYVGDDLCNQLLKAAYKAGVNGKRVMVFHGTFDLTFIDKIRFAQYDRMINLCASNVLTGSAYSMRLLYNKTRLKNIRVVPNGISYDNTITDEEKKSNVNYMSADVHIVNVANFYRVKGQLHLLKAFERLIKNTSKDVTLTLIGHATDKEYYTECIEFIDNNSLGDKVTIVDNIFNSREYMNLFDITVVSSLGGEDLPMVPIEAMRSGVPTIAFACNGIPEEVEDESNGILVKIGDVEKLAEAMRLLVEDDVLRRKLGNRARTDYLNKFTGEKMGERYVEILQDK